MISKVPRGTFKKKRAHPEEDACIVFINTLFYQNRIAYDHITHIANEGKRTPFTGNRLKQMGMKPGVSDYILAYPVAIYSGLWLEMKVKGGKVTDEQKKWLWRMQDAGYATKVAYSADEALICVKDYMKGDLKC